MAELVYFLFFELSNTFPKLAKNQNGAIMRWKLLIVKQRNG